MKGGGGFAILDAVDLGVVALGGGEGGLKCVMGRSEGSGGSSTDGAGPFMAGLGGEDGSGGGMEVFELFERCFRCGVLREARGLRDRLGERSGMQVSESLLLWRPWPTVEL